VGRWHAVRSRAAVSTLDEVDGDAGADSPRRRRALEVAERFAASADLRRGFLRIIGQVVCDNPDIHAEERAHKRRHELADPEAPQVLGARKSAKTIFVGSAASMGREAVDLRGAVLTDGWPVDPELRGEHMLPRVDDEPDSGDGPRPKKLRDEDDASEGEPDSGSSSECPVAKRRRHGQPASSDARDRGEARERAAASAPVPPEWAAAKRRRLTWGPAEIFLI